MSGGVQTSPNKNWDHAGRVQNDGGDDEDEEGEGEREEDPSVIVWPPFVAPPGSSHQQAPEKFTAKTGPIFRGSF
jgi:hypothetical protein